MEAQIVRFLFLVLSLALPFGIHAKGNSGKQCRDFLGHLNQRSGLSAYSLEEKETGEDDPNLVIQNVDIDQDKTNDQILLFRTGSASLMPPDNSTLNVILSSTGEKFSLESPSFYVIKYQFGYYVVASEWLSNQGPIHIDIHSIDKNGINLVCSYKCRPEKSFCKFR